MGVTQQAVAKWFVKKEDVNNTTSCEANIPDARVKVSAKEKGPTDSERGNCPPVQKE